MNVTNVKLLSNFFFNVFGFFMPFWWQWQLTLLILSDFFSIKNLNGLNDLNSLNNLSCLIDLNSLISPKNLLSLIFPSILAPNCSIMVPQCGIIHQKSNILLIFDTLYVRGCGGHRCYFQPNPRIISQMSLANEYTENFFMDESSILDAHLRLLFRAYHYETPCRKDK